MEHRRELEVFKTSVEVNETTYHQKPNCGGQCYNNNNYNNSYNNGKNNPQGSRNNSYKGKSTNGPKVQCKFCFGPREIFQIHKLLEENASNSEQYAEVKAVKSMAKFIKNRTGNSAHTNEIELEALAELVDHPIKHIIHEINQFAFLETEEPNEPHM